MAVFLNKVLTKQPRLNAMKNINKLNRATQNYQMDRISVDISKEDVYGYYKIGDKFIKSFFVR